MHAGKGKRAVLYLIPNRGHFTAALALPDGAMDTVRSGGFPPSLVREIASRGLLAWMVVNDPS